MPMTSDPLVPTQNTRDAAVSALWKAQHGATVAEHALRDCNEIAAAHPLLHLALLPLIRESAALRDSIVSLRLALEQS